jgi:uncharacterized membrane protein
MAFCSKCGQQILDTAAYCPHCGERRGIVPEGGPARAATSGGLSENAASGLSYLLGWVTGIVFFLVDSRREVKFHAAQSIIVFGALSILRMILGGYWAMSWLFGSRRLFPMWGFGWGIASFVSLVMLLLWVYLMVMGFQGRHVKIPLAGDLAEKWSAR